MMTNEELDHISNIVLPSIDGMDIDIAAENLGDFDWSYYDYNGTDVTIGQAVEDYNVYRTFGIGMQETIIVKDDDGKETHVEYRSFGDWCSDNNRDECELADTSEMSMDFEQYGEWKQVWLNCKTGEMITRIKLDKDGVVDGDVKEWTIEEYNPNEHKTFYHGDMSIHPILERNGMDDFCWDNTWYLGNVTKEGHAQRLILSRPYEVLVKTRGSNRAMEYFEHSDVAIAEYLSALRIAKRHGYKLTNKNHQEWDDMVFTMIRLGVDVHNPHYICPTDLKAMHDMMYKRYDKMRKEEEYRKAIEEAANYEKEFKQLRGAYLGIKFSDGTYTVWPLQSKADYVIEGKEMHHCVGSMNYWNKKESICLTVRDMNGNRVTTCEMNLHNGNIIQNYAACDKVHEDDKHIRQLVTDNFWRFEEARPKAKVIPITQPVKQAA